MSGKCPIRSIWLQLFVVLALGLSSCNVDDTYGPVDTYPYVEGHITFQYLLIDPEYIEWYEPMGVLDVFPKDHGGFFHYQAGQLIPTIPIYALADGQITIVGRGMDDQYQMSTKYSTTISTRIGHIGRLADWVLDAIDGIEQGEIRYVFVPVKAGDTVAYVSSQALDLGVHDQSLILNLLNLELQNFESRYAANPLNYYDEPLRSQFAEKILRTGEPKGGKVDYDIQGKLIGNWYLEDKHDYFYANHFAIAYDHVFTSRVCLADGYLGYAASKLAKGTQFWVKGNAPKPEDVGVGTRVKYEGMYHYGRWRRVNGEIQLLDITNVDTNSPVISTWLLEMTGEGELKVELFEGMTGDQVTDFTGNERSYVRKPTWKY